MSVSKIAMGRVHKGAQELCQKRNANLPVEFGKSLYQPEEMGVVFYKAAFLLDSLHCEYTVPVAKVRFDEKQAAWLCFIAKNVEGEHRWEPYYPLMSTPNLELLLTEIEQDPLACFW